MELAGPNLRRDVTAALGDPAAARLALPDWRERLERGPRGMREQLLLARLLIESGEDATALLEELLVDYEGTLLLVSHDRALLNNVVDRTLALEGGGRVGEYAGGYDDWLWQRPQPEDERRSESRDAAVESATTPGSKPAPKPRPPAPAADQSRAHKITFAEKGELAALPGQIETLEQEKQQLYEALSDPELYRENGADVARIQARLDELGKELEAAYEQRLAELRADELQAQMAASAIDVTLPGRPQWRGRLHPATHRRPGKGPWLSGGNRLHGRR